MIGARSACAALAAALAVACGGSVRESGAVTPAAPPAATVAARPEAPPPLLAGQPFVELKTAGQAVVNGQPIAFDGVEEARVWPALDKAVPDESWPAPVVIEFDRGVPTLDVLRAVFTLREADLRLQGADASGAKRFVMIHRRAIHPKGAPRPTVEGKCHLAVFRRDDGSLRVAAPGGPRELAPPDATERLVDALEATRETCPIAYVAFGALDSALAFGPVFDVMLAVDAKHAAGDARYVLAEPVAPPPAK